MQERCFGESLLSAGDDLRRHRNPMSPTQTKSFEEFFRDKRFDSATSHP
jgi:hypothetical protein